MEYEIEELMHSHAVSQVEYEIEELMYSVYMKYGENSDEYLRMSESRREAIRKCGTILLRALCFTVYVLLCRKAV